MNNTSNISPPTIVTTGAHPTAFIHVVVPRGDMPKVFGPTLEELLGALKAEGIAPLGGAFAHHIKMPSDVFDFELGFIVNRPVTATGRVKPGFWPAEKAAHTIYTGGYEGLPDAWGAFMTWADAQKLAMADNIWEHYVLGPHTSPDPGTWRTYLYRPLRA